jgi:hypothetical protein
VTGFLLNANMLVSVWMELLIVRLGPEPSEKPLLGHHVIEVNIKGSAVKDHGLLAPERVGNDDLSSDWIQRPAEFMCAFLLHQAKIVDQNDSIVK